MFAYYRAYFDDVRDNQEFIGRDGKLQMPVLALGGESGFGRGDECLESLKRVAEDVEGGLIPNCGHWVAEEAPIFVAERLRAFFS